MILPSFSHMLLVCCVTLNFIFRIPLSFLMLHHTFILLVELAAGTHAYTTFQTNCTRPETSINFVSSSNARGTLDILWSCLFAALACNWSVLHLNVLRQREDNHSCKLKDPEQTEKHDARWVCLRCSKEDLK
ncbi:hypothetical protein B0J14DRAFT_49629 [Halenospora varia]|nr:hypothetical protein B0J14DRAFT_49629 [Halenospora varia]